MKKTLLVAAVATAMSGAASAADIYGNIRLGLQQTETAGELDTSSGKLVLGAKGSEDLGNGMALRYGLELENDSADTEKSGWSNDKSYVGLGGGFGEIILGEFGDFAGWACGGTDILIHGTDEACDSVHNTSPSNAIQYRGGNDSFNFGVAMINDNSGEMSSLAGVQFATDNFSVGAQMASSGDAPGGLASGGVPQGETGTLIGGTFTLGEIILGVVVADSGEDDDEAAASFGVQIPLGGGTVAAVVTSGDNADDSQESVDLLYSAGLGEAGYWGVEINTVDSWDDDRVTGFIGTTF